VYEQRAKLLFELGRAQVGDVAKRYMLSELRRPKLHRQQLHHGFVANRVVRKLHSAQLLAAVRSAGAHCSAHI
jgi:hypothetical protein